MKEILKTNKMEKINRKVQLVTRGVLSTAFVVSSYAGVALAAGDNPAKDAILSFTDIIVGIVTAIGVILAIWGVVQVGMSIPSHDTSQRAQGFLALAGGIVVAVAPHIVRSVLSGTVSSDYLTGLPQSGGQTGGGGH